MPELVSGIHDLGRETQRDKRKSWMPAKAGMTSRI